MRMELAAEWTTAEWFNSKPLTLAELRGRVVVLGAFQMLCPGCVSTSLPQLQRIHETFDPAEVAVIGLHTVFEHHGAMTAVALAAFLHEYRLTFPIGVDAPSGGRVPLTMARFGFRGTPSLALIDRAGYLRLHQFGHFPDLQLGADIQKMIQETGTLAPVGSGQPVGVGKSECSLDGGCSGS